MKITRLTLCLIFLLSNLIVLSQNFESSFTEAWTNGAWENYLLTTNSLDQNGHITNQLNQTWEIASNSWVNSSRANYSNTESGLPSVIVYENWQNGSWQNLLKYVYNYDSNSNITNLQIQLWSSGSWTNFMQSNYSYNSNSLLGEILTQILTNGNWTNSSRSIYTYGSLEVVSTLVTEVWSNGVWQNNSTQTYSYDANNYLTNLGTQTWDYITNSWIDYQSSYANNEDGTPNQVIMQKWDITSGSWNNYQRTTYTYPDVNSNVLNFSTDTPITIYPNPSPDFIHVNLNELTLNQPFFITDYMGRKLESGILSTGTSTIDVHHLPAGIYLMHIDNHSYRIVKQ